MLRQFVELALGAHTDDEAEVFLLSYTFLTFCQQLREGLGGSAGIIEIKNTEICKKNREKQKQKIRQVDISSFRPSLLAQCAHGPSNFFFTQR